MGAHRLLWIPYSLIWNRLCAPIWGRVAAGEKKSYNEINENCFGTVDFLVYYCRFFMGPLLLLFIGFAYRFSEGQKVDYIFARIRKKVSIFARISFRLLKSIFYVVTILVRFDGWNQSWSLIIFLFSLFENISLLYSIDCNNFEFMSKSYVCQYDSRGVLVTVQKHQLHKNCKFQETVCSRCFRPSSRL